MFDCVGIHHHRESLGWRRNNPMTILARSPKQVVLTLAARRCGVAKLKIFDDTDVIPTCVKNMQSLAGAFNVHLATNFP